MTKVKELLTEKEIGTAKSIVWVNFLEKEYNKLTIEEASYLGWLFVEVDEYGKTKRSDCLHLLAIETLTKRAIEQNKPIF